MERGQIMFLDTDSMKQLVEPESTNALKETFGTDLEVKGTINELERENRRT